MGELLIGNPVPHEYDATQPPHVHIDSELQSILRWHRPLNCHRPTYYTIQFQKNGGKSSVLEEYPVFEPG